jgi:GNAT superfamily N-acetyltransferase
MPIEIRHVEALTEADKQQLFGWGEDIFGVTSLGVRWRPKDSHFLLYADGKAVSHVGILKHVVSVENRPVTVGGVGGVVTVPEAHKKGFARMLMRHAAKFFELEWKADAGLLFCFPRLIPFYESLGWQIVERPVSIEQPHGKISSPLQVMVLSFGGRPWPSGDVELNSLPW